MNSTLRISLLTLSLFSLLSVNARTIFIDGSNITLDLSGSDGRDGRRGANCEAGEDGDDGQSGEDAVLYFNELSDLKRVDLNMSGGLGGDAGQRGSSYNCDSRDGYSRGRDGYPGQLGYISLVKSNELLVKEKRKDSIKLSNSNGSNLEFYSHSWKQEKGTRALFHKHSIIRDTHQVFDKTVYTNIKIELSPRVQQMNLEDLILTIKYDVKYTKTPKLTLFKNNIKVNALIDYSFKNTLNEKVILINRIFYKKDISNTEFLGSFYSEAETTLLMKDPLFLDATFTNSFSFRIYRYHPFINRYVIVGGVSSKFLQVSQNEDVISVKIGTANVFKDEFSVGSKYKVVISTHKKIGENGLSYSMEKYFKIKE
jgi:hypothetical protein